MPNAIFNAENMASTKLSSLLKTVRFVDGGGNPAPINNGMVVTLGALEPNQREIYVATAVAANTDPIHVIDAPEVIYSEEITRGLNDYTNLANIPVRARKLAVGDKFAVSALAIDALGAVPVVGNFLVTPAAGTQWLEAVAIAGQSVACQIKAIDVLGADLIGGRNIPMYSVEVVVA